jgi:hypothetical protein
MLRAAMTIRLELLTTAALALCAGACGNLDNATTVKDLRVLAVRAEPPGFLVPLDDPGSIAATTSTLTALVVDPMGQAQTLSFAGEGCPDYIDTITAASGKGSKLCPRPEVTDKLPPPLNTALATAPLTPGTEPPLVDRSIEYNPSVTFGLTPTQVGLFFSPTPTGIPAIDRSVQYNRDFSLDAIVNLDFTLGTEQATAIKRVVYWPQLPPDLLSADPACAGPQVPNANPVLTGLELYRHRNKTTGDDEDLWPDPEPTLSLAAKDELYVKPIFDASAAEHYLLRVSNAQTRQIETQCRHELLTFQFYVSSGGTFSPPDRQSELSPLLTSPDGKVHVDSQFIPPKPAELIKEGKGTIWVVVRDERAGASWASRTFNLIH